MEKDDDAITIDLSKVKNFFKKKTEKDKVQAIKKETEEVKQEITERLEKERKLEEDKEKIEIIEKDLEKEETEAAIIDGEKRILEKKLDEDKKEIKRIEKDEDIHINLNKIKNIFKNKEWGVFLKKYGLFLLILIPIIFSIHFRVYTYYLPATDDWARNNVYSSYKQQIESQIDQQYPNLPNTNKNALIDTEFEKILKSERKQIEKQITDTSNYFKSRFQDENGQTYLLAIDPYMWYGEARNYVKYGHLGDKMVDDISTYTLRDGRLNKEVTLQLHPIIEANMYKVIHFFNRNVTLLGIAFLMPVILIALSIIPAFFIARRIGGNVGGLFTGMIIAINAALLSRTPAGFSDTDSYNILFPLFLAWIFIAAFETKELKKKIILASLAGIVTGVYSVAWGGWWYAFGFILATIGVYLIYQLIVNAKNIKQGFVRYLSIPTIKNSIMLGVVMFLSSAIFVSLLKGFDSFMTLFKGPSRVIGMKEVAIERLWPNVLTTVAEFNPPQLNDIISQMGGRVLFFLAIIGIILTIIKKNKEGKRDIKYAIFLTIWFIGTLYGFTKGVRFAILMVPAFAIAFGIAIGIIYEYLSSMVTKGLHINKYASKICVFILVSLLLMTPLKAADRTAKQEIPSMCDVWYDSLTAIKDDSEDAVITSWWDFGHWFVTIAERRVTFDGADQGDRIHWVGKSLLTDDEKENIGILKMLNCGQEDSFKVFNKNYNHLDEYDPTTPQTVETIELMNKIMLEENREDAKEILLSTGFSDKEAEETLNYTHCDNLIKQYYITSEDMVGKAGVWGHFGSWDFRRAKMWQTVRGKSYEEGIRILEEEFNLPTEKADTYYYEIQSEKADRWISPWPGFRSGLSGCSKKDEILECGNGAVIDLTTYDAQLPTQDGIKYPISFVYNTKKDLVKKEYEENNIPLSVVLIQKGESYDSLLVDPKLAKSMFVRLFYFDGLGSKHYTILSDKRSVTGQKIQVWNVHWDEQEPITTEKNIAKDGDSVITNYIGWLEDGTVFDSSIIGSDNVSKDTQLTGDLEYRPFSFKLGAGGVVSGFDEAVSGMKINEVKTVNIPPEKAYGLDPDAHPLGNKTLNFKIKLISIE